MKKFAVFLINLYQKFSKYFIPRICRFYPSCSEYTKQCIIKHGFLKGCFLGTLRVLKCHPWHTGGHDPVP